MQNFNLEIIIIGAGGHAKVVLSTLLSQNLKVKGFLDDNPELWGKKICNFPVLGPLTLIEKYSAHKFILGLGNNTVRKAIAETYSSLEWQTAIHANAFVDSSVQVSEGTVIFAGAIIQPDTIIGKHCIINTGAMIDHDGVIKDYIHICPGVKIAGGVSVEEGAMLGIGSVVINNLNIGAWSKLGAGSVAIKDVPSYSVAIGIPASCQKDKEFSKL